VASECDESGRVLRSVAAAAAAAGTGLMGLAASHVDRRGATWDVGLCLVLACGGIVVADRLSREIKATARECMEQLAGDRAEIYRMAVRHRPEAGGGTGLTSMRDR
jgi:hypothetical protein